MVVVCATCKTENRENAMFCRGCAGKLPAFAATGPAAFDIMKSLPLPPASAGTGTAASRGLLQIESRAFWIRLGLLALAITLGVVGWYSYVTRRVSTAAPSASATPTLSMPAAAAAPAPEQAPRPAPQPVAPSEALGPGETLTSPGLPPVGVPFRSDAGQHRAALQRREPSESAHAPTRGATGDPRTACAHLNLMARGRCEAAQCARAEYSRHPHCDAVRAQTRRDIARRDLLF